MLNLRRNFVVSASETGKHNVVANASIGERRALVQASRQGGRGLEVVALDNGGNSSGGGFGISSSIASKNTTLLMLDGIMPTDPHIKRKVFRDIYRHDAIAGGAVDVLSHLPFSDFHLTGIKDRDILDKYHRCTENLRTSILLPALSCDYLTLGSFLGTTTWDDQDRIFTNVLPQNIDDAVVQEIPIFGVEPLFNLTLPKQLQKLFADKKDTRIARILAALPDDVKTLLAKGGTLPLSPENTIFLPRRGLSNEPMGNSFFERILPIHLLEKVLFRGTIDQAYRRQRATLHIQVGGDDEWIPTLEDLNSYKDLFLQADMDPTGAIVVTRTGVNTNEIRAGQDMWSVESIFEFASAVKYRALGISEAILTGDSSLSTLDASLSIMVDNIRGYRSMIERELFYRKIYPQIAIANGYERNERQMVLGRDNANTTEYLGYKSAFVYKNGELDYAICADDRHDFYLGTKRINYDKLLMPRIVWAKHLNPEGDSAYLQQLQEASQLGIPVPMSMFAAAAGVNLNTILNSLPEELSVRKRISEFNEEISQFDLGNDQQQVQAKLNNLITAATSRPAIKQVGLANRDYDERLHPHDVKKNGSFRQTSRQDKVRRTEKLIKQAAQALSERARKENWQILQGNLT